MDGGFLVTVVEISACLIKNQEFVRDYERNVLKIWYKLEEVVTKVAQSDAQLARTYWEVEQRTRLVQKRSEWEGRARG
jgi:hypothetical protein